MASLSELKGQGTSTTTPKRGLSLAELQAQKAPVQPTAPPKGPGFLQSVAQDLANPFLRFGVSGARFVNEFKTLGKSPEEAARIHEQGKQPVDFGYLGKVKPIGGNGNIVEDFKDAGSVALKAASTIIPAAKVPGVVKATLGGKMLQGAVQLGKTGFQSGALYGAGSGLEKEDATVGSVAKETALNAIVGGTGGVLFGGLAPAPVAAKIGLGKVLKPSNIMQRVARINALDQEKFAKAAGKSVGDYLVERGIYGNDEEIMTQLATRFTKSKDVADTELAKLGGTWKSEPVGTALGELLAREQRISSPGALSKDFMRVAELDAKNKAGGLTMSEINEAKRLYERNVRLDYLRQNLPESIARANTLDDAIRTWQFSQAEKLGLQNLKEINKETQLARQLGDALLKKTSRSGGNNAFGLTDAILISGGDPQAIAMLLTKKGFGSKNIQSKIAQTIAGEPTVGMPTAKTRAPIADESRLLPGPSGIDPTINQGRAIPVYPPKNNNMSEYVGSETVVKPNLPTPDLPKQSLPQSTPAQLIETSSKATPEPKASQAELPTGGKEAFAGVGAGFEEDEQGNVTFNEDKALAGMVGMAGLTRSQKVQKLSKGLDDSMRKMFIDYINVVRRGGVKTSKGQTVFESPEAQKAFDKGVSFINGEAGRKFELGKLAASSSGKIANFFEEIVAASKTIPKK